jgi:uncharacterized protein YbjT (DUF2867 family)
LADAVQISRHGRILAPAGDARIAMIDPRDVGEVAASVLTSAGQDGTYEITGPAALTYTDVARELAEVTGRSIAFVDVPPDEARRGLVESGLSEGVAEQVLRLYEQLGRGVAGTVTGVVEDLTGRPPRPFVEFARDHVQVFASEDVGATAT